MSTRKEYRDLLSGDGDALRFILEKQNGQVIDFVIQYEIEIDGQPMPVVRYDGSHGQCHQDHYDWQGTQRKTWLPEHASHQDCLNFGQSDLRANWSTYRHRYFKSRREPTLD